MAQTIKLKRSGTQNAVPTTSQLALGEVALNTYDGKMYIKKSVGGTESIVEIGGDATSSSGLDFTGNLNLEDNVRIVIGDGNDLQIYHDGSASYIKENGTGDLIIQGSNTLRLQGSSNQELANFSTGGAVTLFHNGSAKLATTSTGATVTGTLAADQLKVGPTERIYLDGGSNTFIVEDAADDLGIYVGGSRRLRVNTARTVAAGDLQVAGGDIEFNQSSGQARIRNLLQDTYMRFQVNVGGTQTNAINIRGNNAYVGIGSAEGGSSPVYPLDVYAATADTVARFTSGDNKARLLLADNDTEVFVIAEGSKMSLGFASSLSSTNLTIDPDGRLLVNTTSSVDNLAKIQVVGDSSSLARITLKDVDATNQYTYFEQSGGGTRINTQNGTSNGIFTIGAWNGTTSSDFVRVDSSGQVGIGTTSPSRQLHVLKSGTTSAIMIEAGDGNQSSVDLKNTEGWFRLINDGGSLSVYDQSDSAERFRINTSGNVGIGTTSPQRQLHIVGSDVATGIRLEADTAADATLELLAFDGNNTASIKTLGGNDALVLGTAGTEALRIDSSQRVGIGTTSPTHKLQVVAAGGAYSGGDHITSIFQSPTDHATYLKVKNTNTNSTASAPRAGIDLDVANHADSARARTQFVLRSIAGNDSGGDTSITVPRDLRFFVNNESTLTASSGEQASSSVVAGTEAMRIDSGGNLLLGKTSTSIGVSGLLIEADGKLRPSMTSDVTADFNRLSTDGAIIGFRKDGSTVGSIGSNLGRFYIHNNYGSGSGFRFDNAAIRPSDSSGASEDATTDLGATGSRFKDLHLSGQVNTGTISSGNITTTGYLRGPSTFTIDPAAHGDNTGTVVIAGNLQVDGTTTTINSTTLTVDDKNITLASGSTNGSAANGAGLTVDCGSNEDATWTYSFGDDAWKSNKHILAYTGDGTGVFAVGRDANQAIQIDVSDNYNKITAHQDADENGDHFFDLIRDFDGTGKADFRILNGSDVHMLVDKTGNVGIGTDTPSSLLHLSSASSPSIRVQDTTQNVTLLMYAQNNNAHVGTSSNHPLVIDTNSTERLVVTNTGNFEFNNGNFTEVGTVSSGAITSTGSSSFHDITFDGVMRSTNNANVDGPNFNVSTINKSTTEYAYRVDRSNAFVGGIRIDGGFSTTANIDLLSSASSKINLHQEAFITFYGNSNYQHAIGSRALNGSASDDLRINSYGGVLINLDSNSNNTSGADFVIGRHGAGTGTMSSVLTVSGEDGGITTSGNLLISKTDPTITLFDNSGANTNPNGTIIFSEVSGTNNFKINYNGQNDRLEFRGLVGSTDTELVRINRGTNPALHIFGREHLEYSVQATANKAYGLVVRGNDSGSTGEAASIFLGGIQNTVRGAYLAAEIQSTSNDHDLIIATSGPSAEPSERMRVTGDGKVGIGTTSPSQKLEVAGNAIISGSSNAGSNIALNIGGTGNSAIRTRHIEGKDYQSASAGPLYLNHYHSSNIIMNNGGGNVGMGISTPQARLHIHNAGTGSDAHAYAHFTTGDTGSAASRGLTVGVAADANAAINFRETSGALKIIAGNELQFYSGGSERISINSSGSIEFNNAFRFPTSDGSANQILKTDGSGNVTWATEAAVSANTSISDADGDTKIQVEESADEDKIRFDAAGTERFRIGSDVQVLAATDFNITGANRRLNFTSGTGTVRTTGASSLHLATNNTNRVTIDSSGRVGIGTTSPAKTLDVAANGSSQGIHLNISGVGRLQMYADGDRNYFKGLSGNGHRFTTTGGANVEILNNGNVGIGTTSPASRLQINGASADGWNRNIGLSIDGTEHGKIVVDSDGIKYRTMLSGDHHYFRNSANSTTFLIRDDGNVGVGTTSPACRLHAYHPTTNVVARFESGDGQVWIDLHDSNSGTYGCLIGAEPGNDQLFMVADQGVNRRFIIDNAGQVGIGTNINPVAKLQVEALGIDTTTTTTTATTQVAIDTMAAATFRSAKYTIQVTNSTDSTYHITEVLLIHDGTTPAITEYGTVFTGSAAEATIDADISSGNVRLLATPASTDSMTFKVVRHCITV